MKARNQNTKITLVSDEFVFSRGCSDSQCYKRRRQIFEHAKVQDCRALAAERGLVARTLNLGDNLLYTAPGIDLEAPTCHLKPFISFVGRNFMCEIGERAPSIMEVWGEPEPCTQEEADAYFVERALAECKELHLLEL